MAALREAMRPVRALVDKDFDRYVLSGVGASKASSPLSVPALEPLGLSVSKAQRKAQWEARAHHNALVSDAFRSGPEGAAAYFIDANYELVQVLSTAEVPPQTRRLYTFPISTGRRENVSLQVAGRGRVVYCDGLGALFFLTATDPDKTESGWACEYQCAPLGAVPAVLLAAAFDEQAKRFHLLAAEPVDQTDAEADAAFRLSAIDVFAATAGAGLTHSAVGLAVVPKLPSFMSLSDGRLVLLLEGAYKLLMDAQTTKTEVETTAATSPVTPHKRPHSEDALADDEMDELVSKFPRAGIGYHGDISGVKSPRALASALDMSVSLEERFQKSSTPFSSVSDEPMAEAAAAAASSSSSSTSTRARPLEIPTTESLLGGLEECDDRDPLAKAALLHVDLQHKTVVEQLEIDCKEFRFLCSTASSTDASGTALQQKLVFRNDVHGLVYDVAVGADGKLALRHSATLPAFGFVQASKQDKKFMSALPTAGFACIGEFDKRLFIYLGSAATDEERAQHTRRQFVMELGDQPLLGMQLVSSDTVLVLTPSAVFAVKVPVDSA